MNNTHLCYVYIYEYKCLKNIELVIDCHYNYKFDKEKKTLNITRNEDFPNKFWGENIYSITGLVGNNGAGKTTAMRSLLRLLIDGYVNASINCIAVYLDREFKVYTGANKIEVLFNNQINIKTSKCKIPCFYYSGHFSPYINNSPTEEHVKGLYNASDNVLLVEDYEKYYNKGSMQMNFSLNDYLQSHVAQNNYRICMMLANRHLLKIVKDFTWPKYVIIYTNRSGGTTLTKRNNAINTPKSIPPFRSTYNYNSIIDNYMSVLIYHNLINLINDRYDIFDESDINIIDEWQNIITNNTPIMDQFNKFINGINDPRKKILLNSIYAVLVELVNITEHYHDNQNVPFLYINCEKNEDKLISLGEKILNNNIFISSKFFDIYYAQSLDSNTLPSSGEQKFLDLFSRIYDAFYLNPSKFKDNELPHIIMLDEAEIGFHPDWQRKYMNLVIEFFNALKIINPQMPECQIIISTHSPILLSDIPKCCTNYLKRDSANGITINASKNDINETFAANVFNLYRMSFFMEDGLVGEFASQKINELNKRICNGETEGVMNEIRMIGDEGIQEYLMVKYQKMHPKDELLNNEIIKYYEEKIKQIKNQKEN